MAAESDKSQLTVQTLVASDDYSEYGQCQLLKPSDPCAIVIFGASGDLAARKIVPALFKLFISDYLPASFLVLGCARTDLSDEAFRDKMKAAVANSDVRDLSKWDTFAQNIYYHSVAYDAPDAFQALAVKLQELDTKHRTAGNRLFYLAVPPFLYETIVNMVGQVGIATEHESDNSWHRIVIEKPFGSNLTTARELNTILKRSFQEHQIYRIDHYLAKETVQNILIFRFANSIFEPIWNRQYIEYVDICAAESLGVEHRANYYEKAGVLRDMFQNHMMQLLALIAMEPPAQFLPERVRDEKAKLFQSLTPFDTAHTEKNIVLGQYVAGMINGKSVPAYRDEPGVNHQSLTPTFAMMKLCVDNWRWQGVPFYLTSGKRLTQKRTLIAIQFRGLPHFIFRNIINSPIRANRLTFVIQPNEKIALTFQAKLPGSAVCLRSINMEFSYDTDEAYMLEAYEKVLIDCMNGDQMLFLRQDSEELCWSFLTPLLEDCETCVRRDKLLHFYPAGTWGPDEIKNFGEFDVYKV